MSALTRGIVGLYSLLLRLYPRSFRAEFGEEMLAIFSDAVAETARNGAGPLVMVCLREFRDLPGALFREYGSAIRSRIPSLTYLLKEVTMIDADHNLERPASWAATLGGILPFLLWGLFLIVAKMPRDWGMEDLLSRLTPLMWVFILLPSIGVGIGWVNSFPRWSYPYVGLALVFGLVMTRVATPGLRFFNYTFGSDDLWGWRAWIPLMVIAALALLITRSMGPVTKLFTNAWEDWTRLTFAMFGIMPLYVATNFDEVGSLYSLPFMVVLMFVMVATTLFYLRSTRHSQRVLALAVGIALTTAVAGLAPRFYWFENVSVIILGAVIPGVILIAVMFLPGLVGLLRRSVDSPRHT